MKNIYNVKKKVIKWKDVPIFLRILKFDDEKLVASVYVAEAFNWSGRLMEITIYRDEVEYNGKILVQDLLGLFELRYKEKLAELQNQG